MNTDKIAATAIIKNLPWANNFSSEQIQAFINKIASKDPARILWHARRLEGFGCSELGGIVADFMKGHREFKYRTAPHSFTSAREVVQSKLLVVAEQEQSGHLNRGTEFEDVIKSRFLKQVREREGGTVERDLDGISALKLNENSNKYPWLRGNNIDDMFLINGKRYIVDIKFPKPGTAKDSQTKGVSFDYKVQLEGYGLYAKESGIKVDGYILAPFDFEEYKAFDVMFSPDKDLQKDIIEAGEYYWNKYLLKAKVPDFVSTHKHLAHPKTLSKEAHRLSDQLAVLTQLQTKAKSAADNLRKLVKNEITFQEPQDLTKYSLGIIDATYKEKVELKEDLLLQIAKSANVDLEPFVKNVKTTYHTDKMYEHLLKLKNEGYPIDLSEAAIKVQDVSVSVTKSKKGVRGELKEGINQSTQELIDTYMEKMKSDIEELDPLVLQDLIRTFDFNEEKNLKVSEDLDTAAKVISPTCKPFTF